MHFFLKGDYIDTPVSSPIPCHIHTFYPISESVNICVTGLDNKSSLLQTFLCHSISLYGSASEVTRLFSIKPKSCSTSVDKYDRPLLVSRRQLTPTDFLLLVKVTNRMGASFENIQANLGDVVYVKGSGCVGSPCRSLRRTLSSVKCGTGRCVSLDLQSFNCLT